MARFGLAAIASLSGIAVLSSCVGGDPATIIVLDGGPPASPSSDASADDGNASSSGGIQGTAKDAAVDADAAASVCPKNLTLTAADLDKDFGWKPAVKTPVACSQADLTQLEKNLSSPQVFTYLDLGNGLSPSCKACAISFDTDDAWGPIVATEADGGATGFINFGACYGNIEGAACGKSVQYEQFCYRAQCGDCATPGERATCTDVAGKSAAACKGFKDQIATDCPNFVNTAKECSFFSDAVKTLCGS
jgi:hypothetical protein